MQTLKRVILFALVAGMPAPLLTRPSAAAAADIEVGRVVVKNDYDGRVTVRLYHADAIDREFGAWDFRPGQRAVLHIDGDEFAIGSDWLIAVEFENGVISERHLVWKVGSHGDGQWTIHASDVFDK